MNKLTDLTKLKKKYFVLLTILYFLTILSPITIFMLFGSNTFIFILCCLISSILFASSYYVYEKYLEVIFKQ
jgi:hypothetical protein